MILDLIFGLLISDFLAENLKANKNWQKKSRILQIDLAQKASLILWASINSVM